MTDRHTDTQTHRQTDRHTHRQTHRHKGSSIAQIYEKQRVDQTVELFFLLSTGSKTRVERFCPDVMLKIQQSIVLSFFFLFFCVFHMDKPPGVVKVKRPNGNALYRWHHIWQETAHHYSFNIVGVANSCYSTTHLTTTHTQWTGGCDHIKAFFEAFFILV